MKTDGIILDVDGTLWNTTPIVSKAWTKVADSAGLKQEITADMLKEQFGKTMKDIGDAVFWEKEESERYILLEQCCKEEHIALENVSTDILYEGVKEAIIELSKKYNIFIVSNCQSGYIELFMKTTGLCDYITDFECYGNTGNPKWDNIRAVVTRNHLKAPVYVGDTAGDCEACEKAGVPFIYAAYGFGCVQKYAGRLEAFSELKTLIH